MDNGQEKQKSDIRVNPIIVKEVARIWTFGEKKVNKVLRRYGVIPSMREVYKSRAENYYKKYYE